VGVQPSKADVDPTSGPTRRFSDLRVLVVEVERQAERLRILVQREREDAWPRPALSFYAGNARKIQDCCANPCGMTADGGQWPRRVAASPATEGAGPAGDAGEAELRPVGPRVPAGEVRGPRALLARALAHGPEQRREPHLRRPGGSSRTAVSEMEAPNPLMKHTGMKRMSSGTTQGRCD
jgi:hypothetical protein